MAVRRATAIIAGVAAYAAATGCGVAAESVYTPLELDACAVQRTDPQSGSVWLRCAGHDGIAVLVSEGDLRMDVDFGVANDRFDTFGPFNRVHTTLEWRLEDGVARATILRWFLDRGDGAEDQILVVSTVGAPGRPGCPVALIDAGLNPDANSLARGAADMAPLFDCDRDAVRIVGVAGAAADGFAGVYRGAAQ